jgi:hypothetical protein
MKYYNGCCFPHLLRSYLAIDRRTILDWTLKKYGEKVWTGYILLRIETSGGIL